MTVYWLSNQNILLKRGGVIGDCALFHHSIHSLHYLLPSQRTVLHLNSPVYHNYLRNRHTMLGGKSIADRIRDTFKHAESDYPLYASICKNDIPTLQEALGFPEASLLLSFGDGCWGTPLHVAVYLDNIEAVNLLLQAGVDVAAESSTQEDGLSPLALAASVGNQRLLWRLWQHLHSQTDANKTNVDSCLFQASINSQITVLRALLTWKEWTTEAKDGALFWAARSWKAYSAQLLTSELSFSQDILDRALSYAADYKPLLGDNFKLDYSGDDFLQQQLLIAHLVDNGANPNTAINGQLPIITVACSSNLVGALKVLLDKGANLDATDHRGKTALHFLVRLNDTAIRILLSHNPSIFQADNESEATPLHAAAFGSNLDTLQLYLSSPPFEQRGQALTTKNNYDETLLHYAAAGAKCDIIEFLLSQGLNVNGVNANGWTPLHCALTPTRQGSQLNGLSKSISEALRLLLFHGADPCIVTAEGWTPLHCLSLFSGRKTNDAELIQLVDNLIHRGINIYTQATFIFWNELGDIEPKDFYWGHKVQMSIQNPRNY
ncbi:unnamed protein product [Fusarium graminearum]|uniref:Uncharacterized protein n=1 Tax=Gibberella zeae TaxID=5518 RepID=A0A9N8NFY3_GIBZA|nr:unnamed protein product [Fusarium graminearum]